MKNNYLTDEMRSLVREFNASICVKNNNIPYMELAAFISKGVPCHISHIFLSEEGANRIDISTKFVEKKKDEYVKERNAHKVYDIVEMAWENGFDYLYINGHLLLSRTNIRKLYIESNKAIQRG